MRMARVVPHTAVQVWGIVVVYFCLGPSTTFCLIDEFDSTLSLFYNPSHRGRYDSKMKVSMKKFLLIVCAVFATTLYAAAQQLEDVLYLKNGSVVRGVIMEQQPGRSVKIQTYGGSLFVYSVDEIEKMTREQPQATVQYQQAPAQYQQQAPVRYQQQAPVQYQQAPAQRVAPVRASKQRQGIDWSVRYRGEVNIGYAIAGAKSDWDYDYECSDSYGESESESGILQNGLKTVLSRPLFETVHGIEIGPYFFVGAGVGLQYFCGKMKDAGAAYFGDDTVNGNTRWNAVMLPIFADLKLMYPVNDNFTPFINLGLGGTVGCHSSINDSEEVSEGGVSIEAKYRVKGGFYCDFGAGFRYRSLNLSLGMMHQKFGVAYNYTAEGYEYGYGNVSVEAKSNYYTKFTSFYLKLGVNF